MEPRRPTEPEPVEIVLVALDGVTDHGTDAARPPAAGVGTVPPLTHVVGAVLARVADVPDPPLLPGQHTRPSWSDQRVHRLVRLPPWDAATALARVLATWDGAIGATHAPAERPASRRARRRGRLDLERTSLPTGPIRVEGRLHVRRWTRPTPVVLTLDPWSAQRSHLALRPRRGRFGNHLPRRYYDVAHLVMDEVWHRIERAATT